jgi:phenylalanyl-tRNA synthetase alpha chain
MKVISTTRRMVTSLDELRAGLEELRRANLEELAKARTVDDVEQARIAALGRARGGLNDYKTHITQLPPADRPAFGALFNTVKQELEAAITARRAELSASAPAPAAIDLSMPARREWRGARHPVTIVMEEIEGIFRELGFTIATGPEAEHEWYNFGALNFPPDHPAMDMHDTLYLERGGLLRPHTSPVQIRILQS